MLNQRKAPRKKDTLLLTDGSMIEYHKQSQRISKPQIPSVGHVQASEPPALNVSQGGSVSAAQKHIIIGGSQIQSNRLLLNHNALTKDRSPANSDLFSVLKGASSLR